MWMCLEKVFFSVRRPAALVTFYVRASGVRGASSNAHWLVGVVAIEAFLCVRGRDEMVGPVMGMVFAEFITMEGYLAFKAVMGCGSMGLRWWMPTMWTCIALLIPVSSARWQAHGFYAWQIIVILPIHELAGPSQLRTHLRPSQTKRTYLPHHSLLLMHHVVGSRLVNVRCFSPLAHHVYSLTSTCRPYCLKLSTVTRSTLVISTSI